MVFFAYKKLAQFAVWCALPRRRSESPVCATDNKPSCVLHLLDWFIGSRGFSSLEEGPNVGSYSTLRRKDRGVLMQVEEQKQSKGKRSRFRAGLELRFAKYFVLRFFTTAYFWIFTTLFAKFLSPSDLQKKIINILWDQ